MITIDATKGGANANSYATLEEADAFFDTMYGAGEWAGLEQDEKAKLLIMASRKIDDLPHRYSSAAATQALAYPIDNTVTAGDDGFDEAKRACIEQAFYYFTVVDALNEVPATRILGIKSESLSGNSRNLAGYNPLTQWGGKTLRIMARFIDFSFKVYRG